MERSKWWTACAVLSFATFLLVRHEGAPSARDLDRGAPARAESSSQHPVIGDAETVRSIYERWKRRNAADSSAEIALPLAWSKARSIEHTAATGSARIDLERALVSIEV